MFNGHPKGLYVLFFTEMWERFGFYTVLSIFILYLQENFHWDAAFAGNIYGLFLAAVYFLPLFGGIISDKILGYGKTILLGAFAMGIGYTLMSIPSKEPIFLFIALGVISIGNGLFKPNIYVIVGNLYKNVSGSMKDAAYNIFYMGINLGAFLAPIAAVTTKNFMMEHYHLSLVHAYNAAFGVAALGMFIGILIFLSFKKYYKDADYRISDKGKENSGIVLTKTQEKERISALLIIFAIIIFFWMTYYQNGFTLTLFAKNYTATHVNRFTYLLFDPLSLLSILALIIFLSTALRKAASFKSRIYSGIISFIAITILLFKLNFLPSSNPISPESFQSFNPLFILFLTPIIVASFAWLNKKSKEPSSPGKIGMGMYVTALSFVIMIFASIGLPSVHSVSTSVFSRVTPYWLISSYFVITVAELFLSPMGISFVNKVAPPRMKGVMMGGWFAGQAIGSYLAGFVGRFYVSWQLWQFFLLLVFTSLISASLVMMFLKKLKNAEAN
ncbi:MAG: peptide MFS transporter [Ignavibacteriaceae bacterium]